MTKLNNKGFAITTILFGITLLFCLLLLSLLNLLTIYWSNMQKLVDGINGDTGARNTSIMRETKKNNNSRWANADEIRNDIKNKSKGGLYCINNQCQYYSSGAKTDAS